MAKIRRRDVRIKIGQFTLGNFRILYDLYYGFEDSVNTSTIQIYNKQVEPLLDLPKYTSVSILSDFFRENKEPPKIYEGFVINIEEERHVGYTIVNINTVRNTVRNRALSISNVMIEQPAPLRSVILRVLKDLNINEDNLINTKIIPDVKIENFTFNGSPIELLTILLTPHNVRWSENGTSMFFYSGDLTTGRGGRSRKVNRDTGMILSPGREDLGTYATDSRYISIDTLIDSSYLVGEKLDVKSDTYSGSAIISKIHHEADNWQGKYESHLTCKVA